MSPLLFNVYMDTVMKEVKMWIGEEGREWRLPGLLYVDNLVLCGELEANLKPMVGHLVEVSRRGLKVNAGRSKVMALDVEEGLECEVWDVFWTNQAQMR